MAKILIVDDESNLLQMMRIVLEDKGGYQVAVSADAKEGLALALADPPDLAILDVMMPGMTGYQVCRQIKANPTTSATSVIILTARAQPVDRDAALEAGADAYMTKPVMMNELLDQVNGLLNQQAAAGGPGFAGTAVLMSLRGGVGVTTLAVNLAATLATRAGDGPVCLVDLSPSSGNVALQLGLRPQPNWMDLLQAADGQAPAAGMVEAHLLKHVSGLHVLAAPIFPVVGASIPQVVMQATLTALNQRFAAVIVDTPSVLNEAVMTAIKAASIVGLLLTAESPSLQATIGTLRVLKQWSDKFRIIFNQVTSGPQPSTEAIERTLKRPLAGIIPFDPTQTRALAQGTPLSLHDPNSPLAQAASTLAHTLSHQLVAASH